MPSEPTKPLPSSAASSFASLLASLTAPRRGSEDLLDDIPDEDVSTISYEQALRAHTRYRRPEPSPAQADEVDLSAPKPPQSVQITEWVDSDISPSLAVNRKAASITLRMSRTECAQLRRRAADAGLTVSAYLRSCIFEVESLRAQVKEALEQLRSTNAADAQIPVPPAHPERSTRGWAARLFPSRRSDA